VSYLDLYEYILYLLFLVSRCRSLPYLKSSDNGRKSRNDSGVVLNDEIFNNQPLSIIHNRRRIKFNTTNQFVMHTSSHVCFQKTSSNPNTKHVKRTSCRFYWFFLIFLLFIISILFSFMRFIFFR
jgi:hypothetical protein